MSIKLRAHSQQMYDLLKTILDTEKHGIPGSYIIIDHCYPYYGCNFCGSEWKFNLKEIHEPNCAIYQAQQLIKAIDDWNES